jgi:hypothetical protein
MLNINYITFKAAVTLHLDYSDPILYRGHVLHMAIQYVKYEDFVINSFQDNEQTPF